MNPLTLLIRIGGPPSQGSIEQYGFAHLCTYLFKRSSDDIKPPSRKENLVVWRICFVHFGAVKFHPCHFTGTFTLLLCWAPIRQFTGQLSRIVITKKNFGDSCVEMRIFLWGNRKIPKSFKTNWFLMQKQQLEWAALQSLQEIINTCWNQFILHARNGKGVGNSC